MLAPSPTGPIETSTLPHGGHLYPRGSGAPAIGVDDTNSPTSDIARQATILRQADELIEALSRQWSDEAYLTRVREWADELRQEMQQNPRLLRSQVDEVYDEAYAVLTDLERRIL